MIEVVQKIECNDCGTNVELFETTDGKTRCEKCLDQSNCEIEKLNDFKDMTKHCNDGNFGEMTSWYLNECGDIERLEFIKYCYESCSSTLTDQIVNTLLLNYSCEKDKEEQAMKVI